MAMMVPAARDALAASSRPHSAPNACAWKVYLYLAFSSVESRASMRKSTVLLTWAAASDEGNRRQTAASAVERAGQRNSTLLGWRIIAPSASAARAAAASSRHGLI